MAVAVKNNPESLTQSMSERMRLAAGSLLATVYVVGCLGIVFLLLPYLWWDVCDFSRGSMLAWAGLVVLDLSAAAGLVMLGVMLANILHPPPGLRAGIFAGLVGLVTIFFLAWGLGLLIEGFSQGMVGLLATVILGVLMLGGYAYLFFVPRFQEGLIHLEDQGWFSTAAYKRSQGQQVRRGTILGLIILFGCGIWTLGHKTLETASYRHWEITLPFTKATLDSPGDLVLLLKSGVMDQTQFAATPQVVEVLENAADIGLLKGAQVDKVAIREANNKLKESFKIKDSGDSSYQPDQIVLKSDYEAQRKLLVGEDGKRPPVAVPTTPATVQFKTLTILPDVRFSLPLLLLALSLWFSYRVVNYPVFADFLIATEAELKKVSWTTRKRLVQDTIVVLVTVVLLTVFLFVVDILWGQILSLEFIGVLKKPPTEQTTTAQPDQQQPW